MSLEVGSRLGHYNVTALIGEGGMGQVYRAEEDLVAGGGWESIRGGLTGADLVPTDS
jgi:hypothetical protein